MLVFYHPALSIFQFSKNILIFYSFWEETFLYKKKISTNIWKHFSHDLSQIWFLNFYSNQDLRIFKENKKYKLRFWQIYYIFGKRWGNGWGKKHDTQLCTQSWLPLHGAFSLSLSFLNFYFHLSTLFFPIKCHHVSYAC